MADSLEANMNSENVKVNFSDMYTASMYPIPQFYVSSSVVAAGTAALASAPFSHTNNLSPRCEKSAVGVTTIAPSDERNCGAVVNVTRFNHEKQNVPARGGRHFDDDIILLPGSSTCAAGATQQSLPDSSETELVKNITSQSRITAQPASCQVPGVMIGESYASVALQDGAKNWSKASEKRLSIVPKIESSHCGRDGAVYQTGACAFNGLPYGKYPTFSSSFKVSPEHCSISLNKNRSTIPKLEDNPLFMEGNVYHSGQYGMNSYSSGKYSTFSAPWERLKNTGVFTEEQARSSDSLAEVSGAVPAVYSHSNHHTENLPDDSIAPSNEPIRCQICYLDFTHTNLLAKHYVSHFTPGERHLRCDLCGRSYSRMAHYNRHLKNHTGEKPHKCDYCELAFVRRDHLKKHLITHTGIKPYKCSICSSAFTRSDRLNRHKRMHLAEKQWTCTLCNSRFEGPEQVNEHLVMNKCEKLYKCKLCPSIFFQSDQLDEHTRTVHANSS